MRPVQWVGGTLVAAATFVGAQAFADNRHNQQQGNSQSRSRGCSEATLRGAYGIQMAGSRPSALGGPLESVMGVVIRIYDGHGQFSQRDTVKGSLTGLVSDREGFGTYEVDDDCTAVTRFEPGPGIIIEEKLVIVDGGREALSIVTTPLPVMISTVQKRMSSH
jgi:hypothetical protein